MCGEKSKLVDAYGEWGEDSTKIADVTIRYVKGIVTEDGQEKVKIFTYDICPRCFETKFIRFIGKVPRVEEDA